MSDKKQKLTLTEPWTYRTPVATINYGAGTHSVSGDVHQKAVDEGLVKVSTKEAKDGNGPVHDSQA